MTTVVLSSVVNDPAPSTVVRVRFADGTELEFSSLAALAAWARQADNDRTLTRQLCCAYALARSSDLSNIATVQGKDFIFDLSAPQPIRVQ